MNWWKGGTGQNEGQPGSFLHDSISHPKECACGPKNKTESTLGSSKAGESFVRLEIADDDIREQMMNLNK